MSEHACALGDSSSLARQTIIQHLAYSTLLFSADSTDSDGTIVSCIWRFSDGGESSGLNASKTYALIGSYGVQLIVTDNYGATGEANVTITVK